LLLVKSWKKSGLEFYEILNYYKIVIYILNYLNEDFYYDENTNMHISKVNKRTEFLTFLKKNKDEYIETIAKTLYDNLFYSYQKRIFPGKQVNYSSIKINTDVIEYPVVKINKNRNKFIKFVREKENRVTTMKEFDYQTNKGAEIIRDDKYIWDQIDMLENKIDDLNKPVIDKLKPNNLSVLDFLNDLVLKKSDKNPNEKFSCNFLVSPNENMKLSKKAENNNSLNEYVSINQEEDDSDIIENIKSEIFYNPETKTYDFICRENEQNNRKYLNIKIMMKNWLKEEIQEDALKIANKISQDLWENKYFNYVNISPILINYLDSQRLFWLDIYTKEYENYKRYRQKILIKKEEKNK